MRAESLCYNVTQFFEQQQNNQNKLWSDSISQFSQKYREI